ncbi:MAG: hypothetical protein KDA25_07420 [Phycisphaerales bacterium]|nr:hypothetical protein [Phycisphaerales bacterium]
MLAVTQDHLDAAKLAGACDYLPDVGTPIVDVPHDMLAWFANVSHVTIDTPTADFGSVPLWAMSGSGDGSGYGDGSGDGYGDGDGSGSGYGDGSGSGDGYG